MNKFYHVDGVDATIEYTPQQNIKNTCTLSISHKGGLVSKYEISQADMSDAFIDLFVGNHPNPEPFKTMSVTIDPDDHPALCKWFYTNSLKSSYPYRLISTWKGEERSINSNDEGADMHEMRAWLKIAYFEYLTDKAKIYLARMEAEYVASQRRTQPVGLKKLLEKVADVVKAGLEPGAVIVSIRYFPEQDAVYVDHEASKKIEL